MFAIKVILQKYLVIKRKEDNTFQNIKQMITMWVANQIQNALGSIGYYLVESSNESALQSFFLRLQPIVNPPELMRLGNSNDGGYVLPLHLKNISKVISPGCDKKWDFEKEIFDKYGVTSLILDSEDKRPSNLYSEITYIPKLLGPEDDIDTISLDTLVSDNMQKNSRLILQMDIEGSEYEVLRHAKISSLNQFEIMIIEFHNLGRLRNQAFLDHYVVSVFDSILKSFDILNFNINNFGGTWKFNGKIYPRVIEITFIRKGWQHRYPDRRKVGEQNLNIRNSLFFPHFETEKFYQQFR